MADFTESIPSPGISTDVGGDQNVSDVPRAESSTPSEYGNPLPPLHLFQHEGVMLKINILTHVHGLGLTRTVGVLSEALRRTGFRVTVTRFDRKWYLRAWRGRKRIPKLFGRQLHHYDVNIFLETPVADWFPTAWVNCLIPNQEWVRPDEVDVLPRLDWILCKSDLAREIFERHGLRAVRLGFSSVDRHDPAVRREPNSCVHIAGRSIQKGTLVLSRVWARHPEWPTLVVYSQDQHMDVAPAANIRWVNSFLDDRELRRVQNTHTIHLCPSEAEGWGHYIVEAMSCKAVVVTTDAPPMNEIVVPSRGVLVPYSRTVPQGLGMCYYVDEGALEKKIDEVLRMDPRERDSLGANAREWYTENDLHFRELLKALVEKIADSPGASTKNGHS